MFAKSSLTFWFLLRFRNSTVTVQSSTSRHSIGTLSCQSIWSLNAQCPLLYQSCPLYHHYQHHWFPWQSQSLSHHSFLSAIVPGWSSWQKPVSVQSWWMLVFAGWPTLVCLCVQVRTSAENVANEFVHILPTTPIISSRLTGRVGLMEGKWPYSFYFAWFCFQDLWETERIIFV